MNKRIRLVVTTKNNNVTYSKFQELTPAQMDTLVELCEQLGKLNYFKVEDEHGDSVYFQGDAIESLTIQESKA